MTREELTRQVKAHQERMMRTALRDLKARFEKDMATEQGKKALRAEWPGRA